MPDVCLYFQVHQPNRLIPYDFFHIGEHAFYEDDGLNAEVLSKVSEKCYLPANRMFTRLLKEHGGRFAMAMSISGTVIEQMEAHRPDVLESFQELVATGQVELLAETYYHSLAVLHSRKEFERQVDLHLAEARGRVPGPTPGFPQHRADLQQRHRRPGRDDGLRRRLRRGGRLGAQRHVARTTSTARPHTSARSRPCCATRSLSDDIGFRFSDRRLERVAAEAREVRRAGSPGRRATWSTFSWTTSRSASTSGRTPGSSSSGRDLPDAVEEADLRWVTPTQAIQLFRASREYDCHWPTSWADAERDLSAWMGNVMQQEAIAKIHSLEKEVMEVGDPDLIHVWAKLQTSDHFYWMSTKGGTDGGVHQYFSPYGSPYNAYTYFMNVLGDLQVRLRSAEGGAGCPGRVGDPALSGVFPSP